MLFHDIQQGCLFLTHIDFSVAFALTKYHVCLVHLLAMIVCVFRFFYYNFFGVVCLSLLLFCFIELTVEGFAGVANVLSLLSSFCKWRLNRPIDYVKRACVSIHRVRVKVEMCVSVCVWM